MDLKEFIVKEREFQRSESVIITKLLDYFEKEVVDLTEFKLKTHRYIVYAAFRDDEIENYVQRYAFRTLKDVAGIVGGFGGIYNHSFKWNKLFKLGDKDVSWAYVRNTKHPLVALAALKLDVGLMDLRPGQNDEKTT